MAYTSDDRLRAFLIKGVEYLINQEITYAQFNKGLQKLKFQFGDHRIDNIYKQSFLEVYTKLTPSKKKTLYNYNFPSDVVYQSQEQFQQEIREKYQKIIDTQPQIDYKIPQDQLEGKEASTMRGTDYIRVAQGPKAYTHMRRMLQEIWDIQHKYPGDRFDIDLTFGYDYRSISAWINANASGSEIDLAHQNVIATYKGRGRPKGARNRNTITLNTINDPLSDVIDVETISEQKTIPPQETNQQVNADLSNYVTKPQFESKVAELKTNINDVARNITNALQESYETLEQKVNNLNLNAPRVIHIVKPELREPVDMGIQHRNFPLLLKTVQATMISGRRVIPWVYGPAGTGKSVACEKIAEALSLPYYFLGKTLAKFEILGFINTAGYQTTPFRQAYENGGVFCGDEMDAWANEATVALNNSLANGACAFPDKIVKRHKDFIMVAAANTTGSGATIEYSGRTKQDAATMNRFVFVNWPHDDVLEDNLVANKDWLKYVRHVRARAAVCGINPRPMITMRSSMHGEALLNVGIERETVVEMTLKQGLSDAQWGLLK